MSATKIIIKIFTPVGMTLPYRQNSKQGGDCHFSSLGGDSPLEQ